MPSKQQSKAMKWEVRKIKLADAKPFAENPRKIEDKNQKALSASLRRFGYVDLIVWNEQTGNIVGGHQRYTLLVQQGVKEANMIVVDMSPEEELAANLTLNNPEIEGDWDDPVGELLSRIEDVDPDFFAEAGFDDLRKAVEAMVPKTGQDSYEDKNQEVDIDDLTSDCDIKCPCCDFEWEVDDKDVTVMSKEEQQEVLDG